MLPTLPPSIKAPLSFEFVILIVPPPPLESVPPSNLATSATVPLAGLSALTWNLIGVES